MQCRNDENPARGHHIYQYYIEANITVFSRSVIHIKTFKFNDNSGVFRI